MSKKKRILIAQLRQRGVAEVNFSKFIGHCKFTSFTSVANFEIQTHP